MVAHYDRTEPRATPDDDPATVPVRADVGPAGGCAVLGDRPPVAAR